MGASSLGTLTLDMIAKVGGFLEPVDRAKRKSKEAGKEIAGSAKEAAAAWQFLGGVLGGVVGIISAEAVFSRFIQETRSAADEQAQLAAVLKSTGGAAGYSQAQLNSLADSMESVTSISAGDITLAQTSLLAFTGIVGEQFPRALQAAADMSARTGSTVKQSAETIGRALDVPSKGMAALSKQGFRFSDDQKALIKQLEATGRAAEAQGIILDELEKTYGGAAAAARNTFGGALEALNATISGKLTADDGLPAITSGINAFNDSLRDGVAADALHLIGDAATVAAVAVSARLAASVFAATASMAAGVVESARYQATLARMAGVSASAAVGQTALAGATRLAGGSMALLGGPVGVAILAGAAIYYFATQTSDAQQALDKLDPTMEGLVDRFNQLGAAGKELALKGLNDSIVEQQEEVSELTNRLDALLKINQAIENSKFGFFKEEELDRSNNQILVIRAQIEGAQKKLGDFQGQLAQLNNAASLNAVADGLEKFTNFSAPDLEAITDGMGEYLEAQLKSSDAQADLNKSYKETVASLQKQIDLWGNQSGAVELAYNLERGLLTGLDKQRKEYLVSLQKTIDEQEKLGESQRELMEELDEFGGWEKAFDNSLVEKKIKKTASLTEDAFERMNQAGSNMWKNLANDASSTLDGIEELFLQTLSEMAHEALTKPIVMNFQQKFTGAEAQANGEQANGALSAGGIYGAIAIAVVAGAGIWNKEQDAKFEKMTAEYRQGTQSLGTVLGYGNQKSESINASIEKLQGLAGDSLGINSQMLSALLDIRTGITGVAAGFSRTLTGLGNTGIKTGVSSMIDPRLVSGESGLAEIYSRRDDFSLLAKAGLNDPITDFVSNFLGAVGNKATQELFKKSTKIIDSGIAISGTTLADILSSGALEAFAYADVQTKKKVLGVTTSNKVKTVQESLDEILLGQLAGVFTDSSDLLRQSSEVFGIEFDKYISKLVIDPTKLSLKDLDGAALTKEIESFFSSTLDGWASVMLGGTDTLRKYQEVGEGAFETMIRLAGETAAFSEAAKTLNLNFTATNMAAVDAVQALADAAGGFDSLSGSLNNYANKFLDDSDKLANVQDKVAASFAALGLEIPATRDEFKSLVEDGVANPELFASLMGLVDATDYYLTALEAQQKATEQAAIALNEFMEPFEDKLIKSGMDEFAAAIFDVNKAMLESIERARELGASEAQLAVIREASMLDIRNIKQQQSDSALAELRTAIDSQRMQRKTETKAKLDELAAARDVLLDAADAELKSRIESASSWMRTQIQHYEKQIKSLSDSVSGLRDLSGGLRKTVDELLGLDPASVQRNREVALAGLESAISSARLGKTPGRDEMQSIIDAIGVDAANYSTLEDYLFEAARTASRVAELADLADAQATAEERMIASLEDSIISAELNTDRLIERYQEESIAQIEAINAASQAEIDLVQKNHDDELSELEKQYTAYQDQLNALRGIDASVLTVADAIARLTDAIREEANFYSRAAATVDESAIVKANAELLEEMKALRAETYSFNDESRRNSQDTVDLLREIQYQGEEAA